MGRPRIDICKSCCRGVDEVGPLSYTKRCAGCGEQLQLDNLRQLVDHNGPHFDHWRERIAASVGATLDAPRRRA